MPWKTKIIIGTLLLILAATFPLLPRKHFEEPSQPANSTRSLEQLILPASSPTSSPNQLTTLNDWISYQHVDFPLTYKYPRNWVHGEVILKGIGPKTFQIYPADGSLAIVYITFLDPGSYATLDEFQSIQEEVPRFHGSFARTPLSGINALDENFTRSQYRGGPWIARTVSIFYNETIVEFELQLEYDVSHQDEQAARAIFDRLLDSILLSR